jgi:hypothetical protein
MNARSISTLLFCLLAAPLARAQHVGIAGSYRIGLLEGGRMTEDWRSWCACDRSGSALAQQTLFTAAFLFADETLPLSAGFRIGYGAGLTRFVSPTYPALRPDLPTDAAVQYRESVRSTALRFDLETRYRTGGDLSLMLGPWFEYTLESTLERSERIVTPEGAAFPGEGSERDLAGAPVVKPSSLRWGMGLGLSMSIPMSPSVDLMPHLLVETDLQGIGRARPGVLMLGFGTAVVFDVRGSALAAAPPLAAVPRAAQAPPTTAMITLFAIDGGHHLRTAVARRETTYRRVVVQMPRTIEASLPLDTGAWSVPPVTLASLVGSSPEEIAASALDIVGLRMRANRKATITIVAAVAPTDRSDTVRARMSHLRDRLAKRWDIEPARIAVKIERARDGTTAATIRIDRASAALTAPIVVEWVDERMTLPPLGVDPIVDAPRGVASTRLRLLRGGETLV